MELLKKLEPLAQRLKKMEESPPKQSLFTAVKNRYLISFVVALFGVGCFFLTPFMKTKTIDVEHDAIGTVLDFGSDTTMQLLKWNYDEQNHRMEIALEWEYSALNEEPKILITLYDGNYQLIQVDVVFSDDSLIVLQGTDIPKRAYYLLEVQIEQADLLGDEIINTAKTLSAVTNEMDTEALSFAKTEQEFKVMALKQKITIAEDKIKQLEDNISERETVIKKLENTVQKSESDSEGLSKQEQQKQLEESEQAQLQISSFQQDIQDYKSDKSILEKQIEEYMEGIRQLQSK